MTRALWAAATAALVIAASPTAARTVDYGRSEAELRAIAVDLGLPDMPASPPRGTANIVVENLPSLDHRAVILGIYCSAWAVDNPLSQIVRQALEGWDQDGALTTAPDHPQILVRFEGARTTLRCVEVREMREQCLVRTTIDGTATLTRPGAEPQITRLAIDHQHIHTPSVGCGGLANGTAVAGWTVSTRLLEQLGQVAGE